jgi:hypothetical protein
MESKVCKRDNKFIGKIIIIDWRGRPVVKKLLNNKWFNKGEEDK